MSSEFYTSEAIEGPFTDRGYCYTGGKERLSSKGYGCENSDEEYFKAVRDSRPKKRKSNGIFLGKIRVCKTGEE